MGQAQEVMISKLSEEDLLTMQRKNETTPSILDYHKFSGDKDKFLRIKNQEISLIEGEHLLKAEGNIILTSVSNKLTGYTPIVFKRDKNKRIKIIDLKVGGDVSATNTGFLFFDYSHAQGCNYKFYSDEGLLLNTYKPYSCFSFGIHRNSDNFIVIATQEDFDSKEVKLSILTHNGSVVKEKTIPSQGFGVPNMYLFDGKIYLLLRDEHPNQKLTIFDFNLDKIKEVPTGFVVRHQLSFQDGTLAYLNPGMLVVRDIESADIRWKKVLTSNNTYAIGSSNGGDNISVLLKGKENQKTLMIFNVETGEKKSESTIDIDNPEQNFFKLINTKDGCLIYNWKDVVSFKSLR